MVDWIFIGIMVTGIVAVLIGIWFVKRWKKRRIAAMGFVPPEILLQFEKAEKRLKQSNGEISPYQIMWETANEERLKNMKGGNHGKESNTAETRAANTGSNIASIVPAEPRVESANSNGESQGRQSIQNDIDTSDLVNNRIDKPASSNSKGNFFSRFRRKA